MQDGGRPPLWKKNVKSPYLGNRLTDGTVTQIGPYMDRPLKF